MCVFLNYVFLRLGYDFLRDFLLIIFVVGGRACACTRVGTSLCTLCDEGNGLLHGHVKG